MNTKILILLISIFAYQIYDIAAFGTLQSSAAKGQLMCKGKPYKDAKIKLYDVDLTDFDDLMGETKSDTKGHFYVTGNETEFTTIDPKVNIYHNCEDEKVECLRKIEIVLPKDYVNDGGKAIKVFDIGTLNLSGKYPGESRDCLN